MKTNRDLPWSNSDQVLTEDQKNDRLLDIWKEQRREQDRLNWWRYNRSKSLVIMHIR